VAPERLDEALMRFLLERNHSQRMGALALDGDGNILIRHALAGAELDQRELQGAVRAVQLAAARLRAEILERFGGRAIEASWRVAS
jgi:hypothetical protein